MQTDGNKILLGWIFPSHGLSLVGMPFACANHSPDLRTNDIWNHTSWNQALATYTIVLGIRIESNNGWLLVQGYDPFADKRNRVDPSHLYLEMHPKVRVFPVSVLDDNNVRGAASSSTLPLSLSILGRNELTKPTTWNIGMLA